MLKTIIYVSHSETNNFPSFLDHLLLKAQNKNSIMGITGILLFDRNQFMQVIEGPSHAVDHIYSLICKDERHSQIIKLLSDYGPLRYFSKSGMAFCDISAKNKNYLREICELSSFDYDFIRNKRVFKFIQKFIDGHIHNPLLQQEEWSMASPVRQAQQNLIPYQSFASFPCCFVFQPILDPVKQENLYLEALIRTPHGGSAYEYLSSVPENKKYYDDIYSKQFLFSIASHVLLKHEKVAINIMPESLVCNLHAADQIREYVLQNDITPDRVVIEITENEIASDIDVFLKQIKILKSYGFMISLDDFGAGYAGLSMITKIKPDKIKLDRVIICDIHQDAINQAIVKSVISLCNELEIDLVAEGVENIKEWLWLKAVGIKYIQGFLFSKGSINTRPDISWPVPVSLRNSTTA